jgi:protein TonB
MTVGINQDGSVESIDVRRSSGLLQLDQAATRIVRLAAPYSPLPDHIRATVDVLHITRTWQFSRDFRGLN